MTDSRVCSGKVGFAFNGMGVKTKTLTPNRLVYYTVQPIFLEAIIKA
jgi:hypothetical protein